MNPPDPATVYTLKTIRVLVDMVAMWQRCATCYASTDSQLATAQRREQINIQHIADTLRAEVCLLDTENYKDYQNA